MTDSLTLHVRLFAGLREAAGWSERPVQAPIGATPLHLWRQLELAGAWPGDADHGAGAGLPKGLRVAINQGFAAADTPLADGDELAFLPPISGG
jgi:molybdopterin synthase sulfur carrier subunit